MQVTKVQNNNKPRKPIYSRRGRHQQRRGDKKIKIKIIAVAAAIDQCRVAATAAAVYIIIVVERVVRNELHTIYIYI